ncbi:uncharacterized protein LOC120836683 [Ixodes scapularis]|uniref:uncharacterized protein LOC120836683 n=1 Tax=Ixodes scapularis TaxID=6945 RepID=UPI001A9FB416|nr:uncharacterized protein LOC120836683 [Ixodes scapularis]
MGGCFVPGCNHRSERDSCKFFSGGDAILRADREPGTYSRICSCHFKDGKKSNVPTIFPWNEKKRFQFPDIKSGRR